MSEPLYGSKKTKVREIGVMTDAQSALVSAARHIQAAQDHLTKAAEYQLATEARDLKHKIGEIEITVPFPPWRPEPKNTGEWAVTFTEVPAKPPSDPTV